MKLLKRSLWIIACSLIVFSASSSIFAKDVWLNVRSKNFNLIGNASEKEIKKAATKLEQFRETFRQVFKTTNLTSPIPTNVIVFKSNSYYKAFKPIRADGKVDNFIAGFFQPGEDVNYITLSMDGDDAEVFGTVFHEYVHSILNTNFTSSDIPPWFNEGLAEYYQTFEIEDDQKVKLGLPQSGHLAFLQQNDLIPLKTLFGVTSYGLLQMQPRPRNLFYAESWALIHYLTQSGKADGLGKFLAALANGTDAELAFRNAFQIGYAEMEKDLRKYVGKATYQYNQITFKNKLLFDTGMVVTPMDEAETNAYLGDLLYHTNRAEDAEPYLAKALAVRPDSPMANMAMGMVRFKAKKYDDARQFLEKAVTEENKNHYAYYRFAYVLLRGKSDDSETSGELTEETATRIAKLLKRSIELDPKFFPSYDLLAFTSLISGVGNDDAAAIVAQGLKLKPDDAAMTLRLAELYVRINKIDEAETLAGKVALTADDPQLKSRAESIVGYAGRRKDAEKKVESYSSSTSGGRTSVPQLIRRTISPEEEKKINEKMLIRSINGEFKPLPEGNFRVLGRIEKIACVGGKISYKVNAGSEVLMLTSKDFQGLELMTYGGNGAEVGCDADLNANAAVLTYKGSTTKNSKIRGELLAIDFVPDYFYLMTGDEMAAFDAESSANYVRDEEAAASNARNGFESAMLKAGQGEKRVLGKIETMVCTNSAVLKMSVDGQSLRLAIASDSPMQMRSYAGDPRSINFNCGMKAFAQPVVAIYKDAPDAKTKTDGILVSIEIVPDDFKLN